MEELGLLQAFSLKFTFLINSCSFFAVFIASQVLTFYNQIIQLILLSFFPMRHAIDPKIDCVFKALLGAEANRNLLIHFLNAFLAQELSQPIVWVEILNPYNEKEFLSDKLSIVDVKAK